MKQLRPCRFIVCSSGHLKPWAIGFYTPSIPDRLATPDGRNPAPAEVGSSFQCVLLYTFLTCFTIRPKMMQDFLHQRHGQDMTRLSKF